MGVSTWRQATFRAGIGFGVLIFLVFAFVHMMNPLSQGMFGWYGLLPGAFYGFLVFGLCAVLAWILRTFERK